MNADIRFNYKKRRKLKLYLAIEILKHLDFWRCMLWESSIEKRR